MYCCVTGKFRVMLSLSSNVNVSSEEIAFNSEEKAKELLTFMKGKRKVEKKYSLKRNILMDLND